MKRTVTANSQVDQTFFLYDQGQIVLQFDKAGSGGVAAGDLTHRYLWGPAVDMLLADEQVDWTDNGYGDGDVLWALSDHLGSVGHVVDSAGQERIRRQFDGYGNVVAETHFDASGEEVDSTEAGFVDVVFGYTGKFFDDVTGLQQNWHRWYDAAVGRWVSQDPIGFAGGDQNLARYVANGVAFSTDPAGLAGYREDFIAATPGFPSDWRVHHRYQQVLAERYLSARGINVHSAVHCRGVDPDIHREINAIQMRWWKAKADELQVSINEAYRLVPLSEVDDLVAQIDETFNGLWIKPGANSATIESVRKRVAAALRKPTSSSARIASTLDNLGTGLGAFAIFALLSENATLAKNLACPSIDSQVAFDNFLDQYRYALDEAIDDGRVSQDRLGHFVDALSEWMTAMQFPQNVQAVIVSGLNVAWAESPP